MPRFGLRPGWYWSEDGRLIECQVLLIGGRPVRAYDLRGESISVEPDDVLLSVPDDEPPGLDK